jgi:hypothetical protein
VPLKALTRANRVINAAGRASDQVRRGYNIAGDFGSGFLAGPTRIRAERMALRNGVSVFLLYEHG